MGCCASVSNEVTPCDTPVKQRPGSTFFQEKEIVSRVTTQSTLVPTRPESKESPKPLLKPPPKPYVPVKVKPPPPKKEIEVGSSSNLDGHLQYVDLAQWAPHSDQLITASTDRAAILWSIGRLPSDSGNTNLEGPVQESVVTSASWSNDGDVFALGHDDGKVSLWTKSGDHVFSWWPHEAPVNCVSVSGDGSSPAVLSAGDCAAVSQYVPGLDVQELTQLYFSNSSDLSWVEWVSQDKFLAADVAGNIELHNFDLSRLKRKIAEGKYEDKEKAHRTFPGHSLGVYMVKMKPGSSGTFASCSVDCTVRIWDMREKEDSLVHNLEDHCGYVTSIEWIPDSNILLSASFDYTLKIWDTKHGSLLHSLEKHRDAVSQFSISPDNKYLVSAGRDGDIHFWSAEDGELINSFEGTGRIQQVSWDSTGRRVVATSYKTVTILEINYYPQAKEERLKKRENENKAREDIADKREDHEEKEDPDKNKHRRKHRKKKHR